MSLTELPVVFPPRVQPIDPESAPPIRGGRPDWVKHGLSKGPGYGQLKQLMREQGLHTICEEGQCPNIGECWGQFKTATFLIMGEVCTRNCGFCDVSTGRPVGVDWDEPRRLADAVGKLGLRHVVITSVTRDDLPDGGAGIFAATIRLLHDRDPELSVEVLVPDFQGNEAALTEVLAAGPQVFNHNLETVPRLYGRVRPKADYEQSLWVLKRASELKPGIPTKSGIMLGLGEDPEEVRATFRDLRAHDVQIVTVGQYLRPTLKHLPVERYAPPEEFAELKAYGYSLGFRRVEAAPLVRSSYHAAEHA